MEAAGGAGPRPADTPCRRLRSGGHSRGARPPAIHPSVSPLAVLAVCRGRGFVAAAPGGEGSALFCVRRPSPLPSPRERVAGTPTTPTAPGWAWSRAAGPQRPGLSSQFPRRRCRDRNFLEGLAVFCRDEERRARPRDVVPVPGCPCGRECEALVGCTGAWLRRLAGPGQVRAARKSQPR